MCCDRYLEDEFHGKKLIHIVGEQNQVREFDFGEAKRCPILFNYVPSLTQIHQGVGVGGKRKRDTINGQYAGRWSKLFYRV